MDRVVQHIDERYKLLERSMKKVGYDKNALIEILHSAQETFGYLDKETLKFIAKKLKSPYSKVYGVATFYHYFRLKPKGLHNAVVCLGTACYIKGADKILAAFEKKFDIKVGATTKDTLLSLLSARCVGSCSLAPVVVYDNQPKGNLTPEQAMQKMQEMLDD
ncbi:MAG: bidirectional hydrogenase complex protein HoxE [Sulfurimonas sp.]|nr:bidirectional hydrogenase complex protein HoxE [Sulfurimonas sp.]MDD5203136.1 bidirectional hydrogenase complex protein HoxE [Sulfurimonas sp.]